MPVIKTGYSRLKNSTANGRRLNLKRVNLIIFTLGAVLGFWHLINISDLTAQGFALQELKTQANVLASEKLSNEETVNSIQSYYSLSTRTQQLDMVAVDNVEYLAANRSLVAKK